MNGKKISGNASKATLPGGQKLSDKIQENKVKQGLNNNQNKLSSNNIQDNVNGKENNEEQSSKKNGENNKSKTDNAIQQGGTEASRAALKAAAASNPYTGWIPKGIRDKIVDKVVDSKLGQNVIEKQGKKLKMKMILIVVGIAGSILSAILMIAIIYTVLMGPFAWLADLVNSAKVFFEKLGNWFVGNGYCVEEVCNQNEEEDYYKKMEEVIKKYNDKSSGCLINEDLITATIFYNQIMDEEKGSEEDEETDKNHYFSYLDVSEKIGWQHADDQIEKLVKVYFKGSDELEEDEDVLNYDECNVNMKSYRDYLISKYIDDNYSSMINDSRTKEDIADEILKMGNQMLISRAFATSTYCSSIAVEQDDGNIETMDIEDYVARVVTSENNWYEGDNIENMKAQAIVSRTYALNATSNCSVSIKNSASQQTLADTASEMAKKATEETKGLVLLQNGEVFNSEYDDLAINESKTDDTNYYLKQANLAIPKTWLDSKVTQAQYESYAESSHGRGMSKWGSRYLQTTGKNYEDILGTFYTMAEITKMGGLITGGNYSSSIAPAANKDELAERRDYYKSIGIDYIYTSKSGLVSQCPWYAKSRAIEIIYYSDMDDSLKTTAINSLLATKGDGYQFAGNTDETIFTHSYDCKAVVAGSLVSWSKGKHGHVAIVEKINDDGTILLSDGYNTDYQEDKPSINDWEHVAIRTRIKTLDWMCAHDGYTFVAYAYLLG